MNTDLLYSYAKTKSGHTVILIYSPGQLISAIKYIGANQGRLGLNPHEVYKLGCALADSVENTKCKGL